MLMTMAAENAEDIRTLRFLQSLMSRRNQTGSALKSTSAVHSAVTINGKYQHTIEERRVLTDGLDYESRRRHETCVVKAEMKSHGQHHDPNEPKQNTNAKGNVS